MRSLEERLRARAESEGQGHVFAFWKTLDEAGRGRLLKGIGSIDFGLLGQLRDLIGTADRARAAPRFEPPEIFPLIRDALLAREAAEAREAGATCLRRGEVAYLLVAGGQASRLGFDGPKGALPMGPVSQRSLFEILARRLLAARARHGAPAYWYILTSGANDAETREYFGRHAWFGLDPEQIFFFQQAMLPALDRQGRILMSARDQLFLAPNGHGGVLSALASAGLLADARRRGVRVYSYFQVDNPLAPPADPLFLGLHALAKAQMSSKVVKKRDEAEKVGVLGRLDGRLSCIEYSDLPSDLRLARDAHGELVYGAGNIAMHALDLDFIDELTRNGLALPWHVAQKSMAVIDARGQPANVEGFKFETFVFDALSFANRTVTLEVDRRAEFSPVKNAQGEDSPLSARADLCRLYAHWVEKAGLGLPAAEEGVHPVEVDPLLAEDLETFLELPRKEPQVSPRGHLYQ